MTTADSSLTQRSEIVFIESNVADYAMLIAGLDPALEVHVLDAAGDGLAQMAGILAGRSGIDAIHVISHGSSGAVQLGSLTLNESSLQSHTAELAAIGKALTADGDLLLYGCNVAQSNAGLDFIGKLAQATGADVAASDDLTGRLGAGGAARQRRGERRLPDAGPGFVRGAAGRERPELRQRRPDHGR